MDFDSNVLEHVNFWITSTSKHDCFFIVGPESGPKERIGAIKVLLVAHSEVFQKMLDDSPMAETGDIKVIDSDPETFMNFLKCIYGGTDVVVRILSFEKCISLLYLCEKYLALNLKEEISLLILKLYHPLSVDDVLLGLSSPVCLFDLSDHITDAILKVIKNNTEKILNHDNFLDLDSAAVEFIVKQKQISTEEVILWQAVLKWAKNKADSDDPKVLRSLLVNILKHIRFCAMSGDKFCEMVVPSKVLMPEEVVEICNSIGTKNIPKLNGLCCEISDRKISSSEEIRFTYVLNNIKEFTGKRYSPKFKFGEFYWHIALTNNEDTEELEIYLVCSSVRNKSSWKCCVNFDIEVVNHISGETNFINSVSNHEFTENINNWGFPAFMYFSSLVDIESGYIQNNSVEIITSVELL